MASRSSILRMLWRRCPNSSSKSDLQNSLPSWRSFASKPTPEVRPARQPIDRTSRAQQGRTGPGRPRYGELVRKVATYGDLVLYRSPSQKLYRGNGYAIATAAFGYSIYHSYINFVDPLREVADWILWTNGGICVLTSAMGTAWLMRTGNLVKSIVAVQNGKQTLLRFTVQSARPFSRPREFEVSPRKVSISKRLVVSEDRRQVVGQNIRTQVTANDLKKPSLMMAPLHAMNRGFGDWLQSLKQLTLQDDFIILKVEQEKRPIQLRMDANGHLSSDFFLVGDPIDFK